MILRIVEAEWSRDLAEAKMQGPLAAGAPPRARGCARRAPFRRRQTRDFRESMPLLRLRNSEGKFAICLAKSSP